MVRSSKVNYLVDEGGERRAVVVDVAEYRRLREAAEELAAIAAYDKAKQSGEKPVRFEAAVRRIEADRR